MRLNADKRKKLLEQNDGYTTTTYYSGKNFSETRTYTIKDGELHINSHSKTSWADSRSEDEWVEDDYKKVNRFLHNNEGMLDTSGIS